MKAKYLIITILLLSAVSCKAQQIQPVIKVVAKAETEKNKSVNYDLYSAEKIYYYVSLEKLMDNRWQEVVIDISSQSPDRGAIVNNLPAGKTITGVFLSKQIPSIYKMPGSYRFKLNYGVNVTTVEKNVFSGKFHFQ